eukprot:scaffold1638_cov258-Pinguiococcus_pyrenoidosus.AAC.82
MASEPATVKTASNDSAPAYAQYNVRHRPSPWQRCIVFPPGGAGPDDFCKFATITPRGSNDITAHGSTASTVLKEQIIKSGETCGMTYSTTKAAVITVDMNATTWRVRPPRKQSRRNPVTGAPKMVTKVDREDASPASTLVKPFLRRRMGTAYWAKRCIALIALACTTMTAMTIVSPQEKVLMGLQPTRLGSPCVTAGAPKCICFAATYSECEPYDTMFGGPSAEQGRGFLQGSVRGEALVRQGGSLGVPAFSSPIASGSPLHKSVERSRKHPNRARNEGEEQGEDVVPAKPVRRKRRGAPRNGLREGGHGHGDTKHHRQGLALLHLGNERPLRHDAASRARSNAERSEDRQRDPLEVHAGNEKALPHHHEAGKQHQQDRGVLQDDARARA